ncbi:2311_t:CDS:2 [Funneliformis geosporum]|nr:2311_t:CDS:2 [Funneliformis geosporum]
MLLDSINKRLEIIHIIFKSPGSFTAVPRIGNFDLSSRQPSFTLTQNNQELALRALKFREVNIIIYDSDVLKSSFTHITGEYKVPNLHTQSRIHPPFELTTLSGDRCAEGAEAAAAQAAKILGFDHV